MTVFWMLVWLVAGGALGALVTGLVHEASREVEWERERRMEEWRWARLTPAERLEWLHRRTWEAPDV